MAVVVGAAKEAADALHWIYGVAGMLCTLSSSGIPRLSPHPLPFALFFFFEKEEEENRLTRVFKGGKMLASLQ